MTARLALATSYAYGLMRRSFDGFDTPQHFANCLRREIAIREDRQRVADEARAAAAKAAPRRYFGGFLG